MSPRTAFCVRVGAAVLAALVLAPVFGLLVPEEPFHRTLTRTFQGALVVALLWGRGHPRTWPDRIRALGLRGPHRLVRAGIGAAVALALFALLLLLEWALGGRPAAGPHRTALLPHLGVALFAALAVSLFEEVLVRGYIKEAIGGVPSAVLFAAVHYCTPLEKPWGKSAPPGEHFDPLLGFKRVGELFEAWTDPQNATLGVLSLFLFALALNRLKDRTGTLYAGIGVHGGLVFALAFYRRFLEGETPGSEWIWGGSRLHDGLLGTAALGVLLLLAYRAPLPARLRPTAAGGRGGSGAGS